DALWLQGAITGELLERARTTDRVVTVDIEWGRATVGMCPRVEIARVVPADCQDEVLVAMTRGQPPLVRGETAAAWGVIAEWAGGECVAELHAPLRAWRD